MEIGVLARLSSIQGKYEQVKWFTVKCTIKKEAVLSPVNLEFFCYFLAFLWTVFFFFSEHGNTVVFNNVRRVVLKRSCIIIGAV